MIYVENNVFDEAMNRIRMLFDTHDDIIVSMSGGKDSTVLFEMAMMVAREKGRLPLKVFWLDQEAEWQHTVDYMDWIMRQPDVEPYWYQIPFDFTNSLSPQSNFLKVFDESCPEKWIHQKSDISIKQNPSKYNRYHDLVKHLPESISPDAKQCAVLVGMRITESPRRRMSITGTHALWHGITWCTKNIGNTRKFWPIYDFTDADVWTAIAKNHWRYNEVYDLMYRWGVSRRQMRVSALIHETAWHSLEMLQEFEPKTYNRFVARVPGSHTFNHAFEDAGIVPRTLPFAFKDWKEYRDYLLENITKPEYKDLFRNRWQGQDGEEWYKVHVKEVIINDIDGTVNDNEKYKVLSKIRLDGKYKARREKQFQEYQEYMEGSNGN